jgi:carbamoylphosphate synthase large subunit
LVLTHGDVLLRFKPKLLPHISQQRQELAQTLGAPVLVRPPYSVSDRG